MRIDIWHYRYGQSWYYTRSLVAQKAQFSDELEIKNLYYGVQVYTWLRTLSPTKYKKRWGKKLKITIKKHNPLHPREPTPKQ